MGTKSIKKSLDHLFNMSLMAEKDIDIDSTKWIIFSDLHKGKGDGADDFKKCKRAYHAALEYYLTLGYQLILLGDIEELWECFPKKVLKYYHDTFVLEKRFADLNRYIRVWGNHDDLWRWSDKVKKHLSPFVNEQEVAESKRFRFKIDSKEIIIFLTHGHQGTLASDKFKLVSRLFVRLIWRNIQRILKCRSASPAKNFELRSEQEKAMYSWVVNRKEKLILINGHTHHPVFTSESHEDSLNKELNKMEASLARAKEKDKSRILKEIAYKRAELGWVKAKDKKNPEFEEKPKSRFFNTGCCCFSDGDITGIEIADGEIRLVRWPDDKKKPKPKILESESLRNICKNL